MENGAAQLLTVFLSGKRLVVEKSLLLKAFREIIAFTETRFKGKTC
jgi:hypothetical protein